MTQLDARTASGSVRRPARPGHLLLVVGGSAFFASGPLHPQGTDDGDKTDQLHSMLVDPTWYPAHAIAALGFACVAAGLVVLGRDPELRRSLGRLLPVAQVIAMLGAAGSGVHLFAATQASAIEDGGTTPLVVVFMGVETLVNPLWGLMISALAVRGGLTRALGNRLVLALGVVGGLAFALATATIALVDTFDPLFPVAGLIGLWLVAVGGLGLTLHRT
ncbi:MAG: hypothetical protein ACKVZ6_07190 [Kineosporiaceae bacterium]